MKRRQLAKDGLPALDLIEEAFYWLRQLPLSTAVAYLACALPFILALLFFWAEMSTRPDADRQLPGWLLELTLLFVLAKVGQSILSHSLWSLARGQPGSPWTLGRLFRTACVHLALQPLGLFLLVLSLVIVIPTAWVVVYFQTATLLAGEPGARASEVSRKAWEQTKLWPAQNHSLLTLLSLLGFFIFLNLLLLAFLGPQLLRMLLGVETVFSQSPWSVLNSTVLAALTAVTLLALDPVFKAVYVLRCFRASSRQSGEDLLVTLRGLKSSRLSAWAALALCVGGGLLGSAAENTETPMGSRVDVSAINRSADATLQKREYLWRLPRQELRAKPDGATDLWAQFWEGIGEKIKTAVDWAQKGMQKLADAMRKLFGSRGTSPQSGNFLFDWGSPISVLSKLLLVALTVAVIVLLVRAWRDREPSMATATVSAATGRVDLADESVQAIQLPEDEWLRLARELQQSGELRLAMRALYFASLTHLASRQWILLTPFKSNRDYQLELRRRAHSLPEIFGAFCENVVSFERAWYGDHPVEPEALSTFESRVRRIQGGSPP
ncbi:MAG: DUF4129 domain-containing protein [Verrucomicrobia bacterium]|nr:DUF4129 domain-containing protein [Verrucomicrobiota bacterium]MBI3870302.1 DUF4129 domain-containing protein [Verrucomicrobiota bacterium]